MPKRAAHRLNALSRALVMLVPAWMCFALAAATIHCRLRSRYPLR